MAPRPLRKPLAFLVSALLAVPAGAGDVVAPTEAAPVPSVGAGASVGASASAGSGGVALVPTLSGALSAPTPVLSPALSAAAPGAAPSAAAPAASVPSAAAAAAAPTPAAARSDVPALVASPSAPVQAPSSAGGALSGPARVAGAAAPAFSVDAPHANVDDLIGQMKEYFDGAAPSAGGASAQALGAPAHDGARLAAPNSAAAAPAAAPAISAPTPPAKGPVASLGDSISVALHQAWAKVKQGLAPKPPPPVDLSARIDFALGRKEGPALDALETPDGLLVRAPRARRFDALGYRLLFAAPEGADARPTYDEPVRVRVERGAADAGAAVLRERFAAFNRLIEANFAALELIAQSSSKMTVKTARQVLAKVEEMSREYAAMVGPAEAVDETADVAALGVGFDRAVKGLDDSDLLPPQAVSLVMPLESESLHYYINKLHQDALREVGRADVASSANLVVKLGRGARERQLSLLDLSEHPLVRGGRLASPAFKALVEAMLSAQDQPQGSLILQDHQFWGHFKLGAHSAEVYANFLPPDEGGMIRVRYQEWGTGYDNETRLYYVARLLEKTGFHVDQDSGFLTAVVDKDHASQTVDQMTDTFALVIQALHATVGVDFALPLLVQGAKDSAEVGRRIDQWVDLVVGEGTLPFYRHDDHAGMMAGWLDYSAAEKAASRADLRAGLNRALARLGLAQIPANRALGQRTIDRFFNEPIEAGIARGELRLTAAGGVERDAGSDPLAALAREFVDDPVAAGRMAEAVSSLDPDLFRFETIGSLGALNVERAQRRLAPEGWITVHVLRDPKTGQIGFADAELSQLKPGEAPRRLDAASLFARLAEQGYPVAPFMPSSVPPGVEHFVRLLKSPPAADSSLGRRALGLAASPGHGRPVLARVTYDAEKAARGGLIFVAPYTTPDDLGAIRASKAVLTTSGGLLSHAAITTREMGIPAAILSRAQWRGGAAVLESPLFDKPYRAGGLDARRRRAGGTDGVELPEGALVRLDPGTGAVEIIPDGVDASMLEATSALDAYDRTRDGAELARWIRGRLARGGVPDLQKAVLMRVALDGLAARARARVEAAADLAAFYAVLPKGRAPLADWTEAFARSAFADARADALELLEQKRDAVRGAIAVEAVERALRAGEARAARLSAIAAALGRPSAAAADAARQLESLRAEARGVGARMLAEDVAELERHAREFPNATVEVLPRLKAAIAKARRRGADESLVAAWERKVRALEGSREASLRAQAPAVLTLSQILDMDVPRVGGKAAKLGEISEVVARAGGEVPPAIALTVDAYRRFLRETGIAERLEAVATDARLPPEERSTRARRLILEAPLSPDSGVGAAIVAGLRAEKLDGGMLAVRSSAVDEDGAEAAFAGAGDTHLYVSPQELLPHVKEIWASLWNPRALLYRQSKGLSTTNLAQAVVVQAMVDSEVSGVAFTQDPVSGDSSRLIVNAAFGLGEGVVSGRVAPDQYVVGKSVGREILPPMISDKKLAIVRAKGGSGTEEHKMPPEWRRRRALTPAKLEKLNAVSRALENHFGYALDIEFGFVGDKLYVLQARPVTGAEAEEPAPAAPAARAAARPVGSPVASAAAPEADARRLLFVCTGNTCRSPMAESLAKDKLRREDRDDVEVLSRGLAVADEGAPMSPNARAVLREHGAPADGHAALSLNESDAIWADLVLTMTAEQARDVLRRYPNLKGRVFPLAEYAGTGADIADPYAGGVSQYRAAAAQIEAAVDSALDRAELNAARASPPVSPRRN